MSNGQLLQLVMVGRLVMHRLSALLRPALGGDGSFT